MIEIEHRYLLAVTLMRIARMYRLPTAIRRWLFLAALKRHVRRYRIDGGEWRNFRSRAHHIAVHLYAGIGPEGA